MPGISELLQMIIALDRADTEKAGLRIQQEQVNLAKNRQDMDFSRLPMGDLSTYQAAIKNARDPETLNNLTNWFSSKSGIPLEALNQIAANTVPEIATQNASLLQEFIKSPGNTQDFRSNAASALTSGMGSGSAAVQGATASTINDNPMVGRAAGIKSATGLNSGEFAMDQAAADRPIEDLNSFLDIQRGVRGTWAQIEANQRAKEGISNQTTGLNDQRWYNNAQAFLGAENIKHQDRALSQQGIIGMADLGVRNKVAATDSAKVVNEAQKTDALAKSAARERIRHNIEFASKNSQTKAGSSITVDNIRADWDLIYGAGDFDKKHNTQGQTGVRLTPGIIQQVFKSMGY